MSVGKIIMAIFAAILIFFGVLFIWSAFSSEGSIGNILIGVLTTGIGLTLIFFAFKKPPQVANNQQNVTINLDLPGKTKLESMKCQSCGGVLTSENIKLAAGAAMVTCPYCHTTYQLSEEPKW